MTDLPADCGCEVGPERPGSFIDGTIDYCPMHKAAPEMLAALEKASNVYVVARSYLRRNASARNYVQDAQDAIRAARYAARDQEVGT